MTPESDIAACKDLLRGGSRTFFAASLVLPALTLGAALAAILSRMLRAALLEVLGEDFIRTARAKGLTERAVIFKHALCNALLPVITVSRPNRSVGRSKFFMYCSATPSIPPATPPASAPPATPSGPPKAPQAAPPKYREPFKDVADLKGETVGTGAIDSPQATLLPFALLREHGLRPGEEVAVRRFDVGVGLHGDHVGGERDAARALMSGGVAAACMVDSNHLLFVREGTLPPDGTRVVGRTRPYDHCTMTAARATPETDRFRDLLLSMDASDPGVRTLFDLEGLTAWRPARTSGYALLERAVDDEGFYDPAGAITAPGYRP